MEIFKDFGVSPTLLIAQIVNFLIILFLLKRFMYKPVIDAIKKREEDIRSGLQNAEEGKKILENALEKEKEMLSNAQIQAGKIISSAKEEAEALKKHVEETTKKDTEKLIQQAKDTIKEEARLTEERLIRRIGEIAISLLENSLSGVFGRKEQKIILKKAIDELSRKTL